MTGRDALLALVVVLTWGLNFSVIRIGLESFPPLLLTGLRFLGAALPVFFLARPRVSWRLMMAVAALWFVGQFALLFSAMATGMAPGIAAVLNHVQAPLTILFALVIGERPTSRQFTGVGLALAGLAGIAASVDGDVTAIGFVLALGAASSWAAGNVLYKRVGPVDMTAMIVWLSLLAAIPSLALSLAVEGPERVVIAVAGAGLAGWLAVLYLAVLATFLAWWIWGSLLTRYPVSTVAPFALLVPVLSAVCSAFVFGERFGPLRLAGMLAIVAGLAVIAWPARRQAK